MYSLIQLLFFHCFLFKFMNIDLEKESWPHSMYETKKGDDKTAIFENEINSFEDCCRSRCGSSYATLSFLLLSDSFFYVFSFLWFHLIDSECPSRNVATGWYQSTFFIQYPPSALLLFPLFYLLYKEFYIYPSLIVFFSFPYHFSLTCLHAIFDIIFA